MSVKRKTDQKLFWLSLAVCLFWVLGLNINVYSLAVLGAIFEFLWLPMLGALFFLPLLNLYLWYRVKFSLKYWFILTILLHGIIVLLLMNSDL